MSFFLLKARTKRLALFLFLCVSFSALAQTTTIVKVKVFDGATKETAVGVIIHVKGTTLGTTT
ncbi:MAG TPA: hypothetical protein VFF27_04790, partial [Bacteroidia bacterium]|nr:hypothetical protein [Bacteroidia bacterium]